MERTEPVNPERKVSLLLKIWLCPNVTAFKIVKALPSLSDYRRNYHSRSFAFAIIVFTEAICVYYAFPHITNENFKFLLITISLFHGLPELIFNKQINEMAFDYYSYYNKGLLYLFGVFMITGLIGFILFFNDQIGHVK